MVVSGWLEGGTGEVGFEFFASVSVETGGGLGVEVSDSRACVDGRI